MNEVVTLADLYNRGIQTHVKGRSSAADTEDGVRLALYESTTADGYANSQIDDYRVDQRNTFRWRADVRLSLRARFSCGADELSGTAGFGFWNAPIGLGERSIPTPPAAAWFFFGGSKSNMPAAIGVPGNGWKTACMDTCNAAFLALLPTAPLALPFMRWRAAYERLWPIAQRAMRVDEKTLANEMTEWRDYAITWTKSELVFEIDNQIVHTCRTSPRSRMGFVAWIDNQYMVATPQGRFSQGTVPIEKARSLELADLSLTRVN